MGSGAGDVESDTSGVGLVAGAVKGNVDGCTWYYSQQDLQWNIPTTYGLHSVSYRGPTLWNKIPNDPRLNAGLCKFKNGLKDVDISSIEDRLA